MLNVSFRHTLEDPVQALFPSQMRIPQLFHAPPQVFFFHTKSCAEPSHLCVQVVIIRRKRNCKYHSSLPQRAGMAPSFYSWFICISILVSDTGSATQVQLAMKYEVSCVPHSASSFLGYLFSSLMVKLGSSSPVFEKQT